MVSQGAASKSMRFYSWRKKGDVWKVDLARMDTKNWNFEKIAACAEELKQKHGITSL